MENTDAPKILIVEDEEDVLEIISFMVENAGYQAITARNGQEGLAKALQERPQLIISDVLMPVMNGYELYKALKAGADPKKIVYASVGKTRAEIREAMSSKLVPKYRSCETAHFPALQERFAHVASSLAPSAGSGRTASGNPDLAPDIAASISSAVSAVSKIASSSSQPFRLLLLNEPI